MGLLDSFKDAGGDLLKVGGDIYGAYEQSDRAASASKLAYKRTLYMSNTAIQRRVEDLKAAGLNPMLAYNSAASAGSVAAAPMTGPVGLGRNLSTFLERQESRSRTKSNEASAEAASASAMKARTETANMAINAAYTAQQTALLEAQTRRQEMEITDMAKRMRDDPERYANERDIRLLNQRLSEYTENQARMMSKFWTGNTGETAAYVQGFGPAINAAGDVLNIGNQLKDFVKGFKGIFK
jgi:hypothetical protein